MKLKDLQKISSLFNFKVVTDLNDNEYVLYADSIINEITFEIEDKTQFEAVENHIHLVDNVKSDFNDFMETGKTLGETLLSVLKSKYPDKKFCVFVTVDIGEAMIIRFHQIWRNEPLYYNPDNFNSENTRILMFK